MRRVLAESGTNYHPLAPATLARYREALRAGTSPAAVENIEIPSTLAALDPLEKQSLIWRTSRGVYECEDTAIGCVTEASSRTLI